MLFFSGARRLADARARCPHDRRRRRRLPFEPSAVVVEHAAFGLLSAGGVLGLRRLCARTRRCEETRPPQRYCDALCLAAGIVTALCRGSATGRLRTLYALGRPVGRCAVGGRCRRCSPPRTSCGSVSGVAWMQRLPRRYAENRSSLRRPAGPAADRLDCARVAATLKTTTL